MKIRSLFPHQNTSDISPPGPGPWSPCSAPWWSASAAWSWSPPPARPVPGPQCTPAVTPVSRSRGRVVRSANNNYERLRLMIKYFRLMKNVVFLLMTTFHLTVLQMICVNIDLSIWEKFPMHWRRKSIKIKKNIEKRYLTSSSSLKCQALQWNQNDWFCRSSVLNYLIC